MVRIITDSAADFEPDELKNHNITSVPLTVMFGDAEYQENVNLSKKMFYGLLETQSQFPKTSQPSPYTFQCVLEEAKESGDEAVVITLSSALSGTYQGAVLAKQLLDYEKCYVIDSLTLTGGQRILVEYAVKLRDMGKQAREIVEEINALRSKVTLYACVDTLEYLRRGGRVSHAVAAIGTLTHIKPILHMTQDGSVDIIAKAMGRGHGMRRLLKYMEVQKPDMQFPIYVMYSHIQENAEVLAEYLRKAGYVISKKQIVNVGAAIGSHVGPNAFGLVYMAER